MFLEQCLAITREVGDRYSEGLTLADLAGVHVADRRFEEAGTYLQESLAVFQELGDRYAVGQVLKNFGLIVDHVRGHQAARRYWEAALDALTPLHDPDVTRIQGWIEQPGQKRPRWSEWEL